jgi:hypothetical protein
MERSDYDDSSHENRDYFDDNIDEYIHRFLHCTQRTQAIHLRTNALKYIDRWRREQLEQLDQRVRLAGQSVLNAFDNYQGKYVKRDNFNDNSM